MLRVDIILSFSLQESPRCLSIQMCASNSPARRMTPILTVSRGTKPDRNSKSSTSDVLVNENLVRQIDFEAEESPLDSPGRLELDAV